jgi:hypothetical protein
MLVIPTGGVFWKAAIAAPTTRTYKTYYKVCTYLLNGGRGRAFLTTVVAK